MTLHLNEGDTVFGTTELGSKPSKKMMSAFAAFAIVTAGFFGATGMTSAHAVVAINDATATVAADAAASCDGPSTVQFEIANATWDTTEEVSAGTYQRTATADEGHLFADGQPTATVDYTIEPALPSQSIDPTGECYVEPAELPNNPVYNYVLSCGQVDITFTNPVELTDNQTAPPAVFTYTDEVGTVNQVSVPVNGTISVTVSFIEDSLNSVVRVGPLGEVQQQVSVPTDCQPNEGFEFYPHDPSFTDSRGVSDDGYAVPGTLTSALSSTDDSGNSIRTETYEVEEGEYVAVDVNYECVRSVAVVFTPRDGYVVAAPGWGNFYQLVDGLAVWEYTYEGNTCDPTNPAPPGPEEPQPPVTPEEPPVTPQPPVTNPDPNELPISGGQPTPEEETVKPVTDTKQPVKKHDKLAATGSESSGPGLLFAGSLVLLGLGMVAVRKARANVAVRNDNQH